LGNGRGKQSEILMLRELLGRWANEMKFPFDREIVFGSEARDARAIG